MAFQNLKPGFHAGFYFALLKRSSLSHLIDKTKGFAVEKPHQRRQIMTAA